MARAPTHGRWARAEGDRNRANPLKRIISRKDGSRVPVADRLGRVLTNRETMVSRSCFDLTERKRAGKPRASESERR